MNNAIFKSVSVETLANFQSHIKNAKNKELYQKILENRETQAINAFLYYYFAEFNGMVFVRESSVNGGYLAIGFANRSAKPCFYNFFKDFSELENFCEKFKVRMMKKIDDEKQKKADKNALSNVKDYINIDDVFKCAWGYESTSVDYYQVVGFKGKSTVILRLIGNEISKTYTSESGECLPIVNGFISDELIEKRLNLRPNQYNTRGIDASFKVNSFSNAYLKCKDDKGNYQADYWSNY